MLQLQQNQAGGSQTAIHSIDPLTVKQDAQPAYDNKCTKETKQTETLGLKQDVSTKESLPLLSLWLFKYF